MISAAFKVNGEANPGTHIVAYGADVTCVLQSFSGAQSIVWEMLGVSHTDIAKPSLTISGAPLGQTCAFTMAADHGGGEGRSVHLRCTVTDAAGNIAQEATIIGAANVLGIVPLCPGEELERDNTQGWVGPLNTALANAGGGGGGLVVTGDPVVGYVPTWDGAGAVWASTLAFTINSFAATSSLIETGNSAINPGFTASFSSTPTTLVLTNNFDSESKDVHTTPTAFTSSHTFPFATPNLSITFTITATHPPNPAPSPRSASIISGQRTYAGVVAAGSSLATLIAGATFTSILTARGFSFTVTGTGGTSRAQWAYPARYGTPATVKDNSTGFGVAYTLLGAFSRTNAFGYTENYNQYETVSSFTGSLTVVVT